MSQRANLVQAKNIVRYNAPFLKSQRHIRSWKLDEASVCLDVHVSEPGPELNNLTVFEEPYYLPVVTHHDNADPPPLLAQKARCAPCTIM